MCQVSPSNDTVVCAVTGRHRIEASSLLCRSQGGWRHRGRLQQHTVLSVWNIKYDSQMWKTPPAASLPSALGGCEPAKPTKTCDGLVDLAAVEVFSNAFLCKNRSILDDTIFFSFRSTPCDVALLWPTYFFCFVSRLSQWCLWGWQIWMSSITCDDKQHMHEFAQPLLLKRIEMLYWFKFKQMYYSL